MCAPGFVNWRPALGHAASRRDFTKGALALPLVVARGATTLVAGRQRCRGTNRNDDIDIGACEVHKGFGRRSEWTRQPPILDRHVLADREPKFTQADQKCHTSCWRPSAGLPACCAQATSGAALRAAAAPVLAKNLRREIIR